jgi:hypothetical protein
VDSSDEETLDSGEEETVDSSDEETVDSGEEEPVDSKNKECFTDDDCYIKQETILRLFGKNDCYKFDGVCYKDNKCAIYTSVCITPFPCEIPEGAFGDACQEQHEECKRLEEELQQSSPEDYLPPVCGAGFQTLNELSAVAGIGVQEGKAPKRAGQCAINECRNRAGNCCKLVQRSSKKICPPIC